MKKKKYVFVALFIALSLLVSCTKSESAGTATSASSDSATAVTAGVSSSKAEKKTVKKAETVSAKGNFVKTDSGIALEKELEGTYTSGDSVKNGKLLFSILLYDDRYLDITLDENGDGKALSTMKSLSEEYTVVITDGNGEETTFTGTVIRNSSGIFNTIEVEDAFSLFPKNKTLRIRITCDSGSYDLGEINTSSVEALRYDRAEYDRIVSLMNGGEYWSAITEIMNLYNNDRDSYLFYSCRDLIYECKASLYEEGFQYYLNQEYEKAAEAFENLYYNDSQDLYEECCGEVGKKLYETGDYSNAIAVFQKGSIYPDEYFESCRKLSQEGKSEEALEALKKHYHYSDDAAGIMAEVYREIIADKTDEEAMEFLMEEASYFNHWEAVYDEIVFIVYERLNKMIEEGSYEYPLAVLKELYYSDVYYYYADMITDAIIHCYTDLGMWEVGMPGPAGGEIFYDCDADNDEGNADGLISSECGWRYLEMSPWRLEDTYTFGGYGTKIGNTSEAVGTGKANTEAIVNKLGNGTYAAKACLDYECGGYDDWFLPSKDELDLMYCNCYENGSWYADESYLYWSSSESDSYYAWLQSVYNGSQDDCRRSYDYYVRPVRAF